ncbi:MAG: transposase [Candidatus Acidiferrales bacterium]
MPKGLERRYGHGHLHFITFSCYRRLPLLKSVRARNLLVEFLGQIRARYEFSLVGYVVMPEHVHLLVGEPLLGTPSIVMQVLKQRVSRELRHVRFDASGMELLQFWQPRFYDFNVWSREKRIEKLRYMHRNPVTRGLVERPEDWIWSSYCFYARTGRVLISLDVVE